MYPRGHYAADFWGSCVATNTCNHTADFLKLFFDFFSHLFFYFIIIFTLRFSGPHASANLRCEGIKEEQSAREPEFKKKIIVGH